MSEFVGAIDQGTTSSRFAVIDRSGHIVAMEQMEHGQHYPQPGLVEHDPAEIWDNCQAVIERTLTSAEITASDLAAVGITNQRETVIAWNGAGTPLAPAIVWQDTRTADLCRRLEPHGELLEEVTGLPLSTYFSGPKMRWLLDEVPAVAGAAEAGDLHLGTVDAWLSWNLTGEAVTDPTNASRTMLLDLADCEWSDRAGDVFGVDESSLPRIVDSSGIAGTCRGVLDGVPLAGILGDQQAALFGQAGTSKGSSKNTYGTGCFLLQNTGDSIVRSDHGLLPTVAYRHDGVTSYALEGSVAVAGAAVQWLRDGLGLIEDSSEIEALAASVGDTGDVYLVPAFGGLFAPYWRTDARGVIVGLTRFTTAAHLARATLEATGFQTFEVLDAMTQDTGRPLTELRVDGGMTRNALLMQFQADVLGVPVIRPMNTETTVVGAAYAAGLAVGVWQDFDELAGLWQEDKRWEPEMDRDDAGALVARWRQAVERSFGWVS